MPRHTEMLTTIRTALNHGGVRTTVGQRASAGRMDKEMHRATQRASPALLNEGSTPPCEHPKKTMLRFVDA